jgi:hypothetical protein
VTAEYGKLRQKTVVSGGSGFCSQNSRRVHFGLGAAAAVDRLTIRWPSGREQTLEHLPADRVVKITEPAK